MAHRSKIEWTETIWNPVTGCSKVSSGCKHCYAETMHKRLRSMRSKKYQEPFDTITLHDRELGRRFGVKPKRVFTCSMSDLFHEEVPDWFLYTAFANMACQENCHHVFQVLTKRTYRMLELMRQPAVVEDIYAHWHSVSGSPAEMWSWPLPNVWLGTSVENEKTAGRIRLLKENPAKVKFLSLEPLLGPLPGINLDGIDWVIVGGESGPGARSMDAQWVREIRDNCLQSGGVFKQRTGRMLDGRTWDQVAPGRFFKSRLTGPQISSKSLLRIFTILSSSSFVSTMKGRGGIVTFLLRPAFPPN